MKTAFVLIAALSIATGASAQSMFGNTSSVPYLYTAHNPTERVVVTPEIRRFVDSLSIDRDVARSKNHLSMLVNSRKMSDGRYEVCVGTGDFSGFAGEERITKKQLEVLITSERKHLKSLVAKRSELLSVK